MINVHFLDVNLHLFDHCADGRTIKTTKQYPPPDKKKMELPPNEGLIFVLKWDSLLRLFHLFLFEVTCFKNRIVTLFCFTDGKVMRYVLIRKITVTMAWPLSRGSSPGPSMPYTCRH